VIEAVTAQQLRRMVEQYHPLPDHQMGARKHRSTETALDLIMNQVRTVWQAGDYVASLLSLDITGAFDRVVKSRLLHVLKAKGVPEPLVRWVGAFMTGRTTTLVLSDAETDGFSRLCGSRHTSRVPPVAYPLPLLHCGAPRPLQQLGGKA
jgi:Reverse transcriptase (RNA-dependent DNA polymerase)